jgi:hypothetical protein
MHLTDVRASDKGLLTGSGQYHRAYGVVLRGLRERQGQLVQGVAVERIELVRPIDGNRAYGIAIADFKVAVGHGRLRIEDKALILAAGTFVDPCFLRQTLIDGAEKVAQLQEMAEPLRMAALAVCLPPWRK